MKRSELEHLIRAAGSIGKDSEIVVIGSQAILAQFPDAPESLLVSAEADVFPLNRPEQSDLIDGAIGEGSRFHQEFGYYAQGVEERTAVLPRGWRERLVPICNQNTNNVVGLCLEINDLAISKYVAGRPKDLDFTKELAAYAMTSLDTLIKRIDETDVIPDVRDIIRARVRRDFGDLSS
jgi:Nucleotidyltransferase of unknown function (DUF6036)